MKIPSSIKDFVPLTSKDVLNFRDEMYVQKNLSPYIVQECVLGGEDGSISMSLTGHERQDSIRMALLEANMPRIHKAFADTYKDIQHCLRISHITLDSDGWSEFRGKNKTSYHCNVADLRDNQIREEQRRLELDCLRLRNFIVMKALNCVAENKVDRSPDSEREYVLQLFRILQNSPEDIETQKECIEELLSYDCTRIAFDAYQFVSEFAIKKRLLKFITQKRDFQIIYEMLLGRMVEEQNLLKVLIIFLRDAKDSPYYHRGLNELPVALFEVVRKYW